MWCGDEPSRPIYRDLPHWLAVVEDCGLLAADRRNDGAVERLASVLGHILLGVNNRRVQDSSFLSREPR